MPWTFVRPVDLSLLAGRPLLDIGTGDGQTLRSLVAGPGLVVGLDHLLLPLRAAHLHRLVCANAERLPFADATFDVILAADLFHHQDDAAIRVILEEGARVLAPAGRLVAWWYAVSGRGGAGDPRFPRRVDDVARAAASAGLLATPIELEVAEGMPETVGLTATRR